MLSKPVSRTAFIVSKLIANSVGVMATMLLFPGLGVYLQITLAGGGWIPPLNFLGGLAILALYQLFFLTLTLMLGTLFSHRAPVIGIPLALAFGQSMILNMIPQLGVVLPWTLIASPDEQVPSITEAIITGAVPASFLPVGSILILIVAFIGIALWRFEREDHDRERIRESPARNQARDVVCQGDVTDQEHDGPFTRMGGAQRAGDEPVDAVCAAIAQDAVTHEVLMLAWMNADALAATIETGRAT